MTDGLRALRLLTALWLRELRTLALWSIIGTMLLPILVVAGLQLADLLIGPERQALAIGGSGIIAVLGMVCLVMPPFVARMKAPPQLIFFSAFPVARWPFLGSFLVVFGLLAVPGMVGTALLASLIIHVPLHISLLSLLMVPLMLLAFTAIGLLLGMAASQERTAHLLGLIVYIVLVAAPLFLLISHHVSPIVQWAGALLPTGVAEDAAAGIVRSNLTDIPLDGLILLAYTLLATFLADRQFEWHPGKRHLTFAPRV